MNPYTNDLYPLGVGINAEASPNCYKGFCRSLCTVDDNAVIPLTGQWQKGHSWCWLTTDGEQDRVPCGNGCKPGGRCASGGDAGGCGV